MMLCWRTCRELTLRGALIVSMIASPVWGHWAWARSTPQVSTIPFEGSESTVLNFSRSGNIDYYRALGLERFEGRASVEQIREAAQRVPRFSDFSGVVQSANMESSQGRATVLSQLRQMEYLLQAAKGQPLVSVDESMRLYEAEVKRLNQFKERNGKSWSPQEISERARVQVLARKIEGNLSFSQQAQDIFRQAGDLLTNQRARARYDFETGRLRGTLPEWSMRDLPRSLEEAGRNLRWNSQGYTQIVIEPTHGERYTLKVENPRELINMRASETMAEIRSGAVNLSVMMAGFLTIMYGWAHLKMWQDYEMNPMAVVDAAEDYFSSLMAISFMNFFVVAHGANSAVSRLHQLNIRNGLYLAQSRHLYANQELWRRAMDNQIRTLRVPFIGLGALAAVVTMYGGSKLDACLAVASGRPMSIDQRMQKNQICDEAWRDYIEQVTPSAIRAIATMTAGYALFAQGMSRIQRGRAHYAEAARVRQAGGVAQAVDSYMDPRRQTSTNPAQFRTGMPSGVHPGEVAPKSFRLYLLRGAVVGVTSIIALAGFVVVVEVLDQAIEAFDRNFNYYRPIRLAMDGSRRKLEQFHYLFSEDFKHEVGGQEEWAQLRSEEGFQKWSSECIRMLGEEGEACDINSVVNYYGRLNHNYRNSLLLPYMEAYLKWQEKMAEAYNHYLGSSLFYKTLVSQISAMRQMHNSENLPNYSSQIVSFDTLLEYAHQPLPLFRSSPLFGVKSDYTWVGNYGAKGGALAEFLERMMRGLRGEEESSLEQSANTRGTEVQLKIQELEAFGSFEEGMSGVFSRRNLEGAKLFPSDKSELSTEYLSEKNIVLLSQQKFLAATGRRFLGQIDELNMNPRAKSYVERIFRHLIQGEHHLSESLRGIYYINQALQREPGLCVYENDGPECFFHWLKSEIMDPNFLTEIDPVTEVRRPLRDVGGYQKNPRSLPRGFSSLAPGHEFLLSAYLPLRYAGVDDGWYPEHFSGQHVNSIVHYYLLTALCGPQVRFDSSLVRQSWYHRDQFIPPRLPLKNNVDFCQQIKDWENPLALYHEIKHPEDSTKVYQGIIDLLYQEMSPELEGDKFANWWDDRVFPYMEVAVRNNVQRIEDELVSGGLKEMVQSQRRTWLYDLPRGYLDSLQEEVSFYFEFILDPAVKGSPWYEGVERPHPNEEPEQFYERLKLRFLSNMEKLGSVHDLTGTREVEALRSEVMEDLNTLKELTGTQDVSLSDPSHPQILLYTEYVSLVLNALNRIGIAIEDTISAHNYRELVRMEFEAAEGSAPLEAVMPKLGEESMENELPN